MKKKIIINGKETNYSVTDEGKIFNDVTNKELKGTYKTNEYHSIQLVIEGYPKTFMVHRLVAEAFCPNPNHWTIVDHIDQDKTNDKASNLRWVTSKMNANNIFARKLATKNQKFIGEFDSNWRPVYGVNGFMVSSTGKVVNIKTKNILVEQDRHGYKRINLGNKRYSLHILVWEAFNEQKVPNGLQIDHIDGNKSNNCLSNLRLVNSSENMKNAYSNGHANAIKVKQYSLKGEYIQSFPTIREAASSINAKEAGLKEATLHYWTCGGYYWLRENDDITIEEVLYNWVPEGYKIIPSYPTYCINKEGIVYNKRNKKETPRKIRENGTYFVNINGKRISISDLLQETFNMP